MTKDELTKLLEGVNQPVYKIEADLGMPKTTLQKALKGKRELSMKWERLLKDKFFRPSDSDLMKLPIDYNRPLADYFTLIRQFLDRNSLLILKHEIENSRVLSPDQKKSQLSTLSCKLQRTK